MVALGTLGLLGLAVAVAVAWPFLAVDHRDEVDDPRADERREVAENLERVLAAVQEIELDRRAGNLSQEDFTALDRQERARAVALMRRRDDLDGRRADAGSQASPAGRGGSPRGRS